MKQSQLNIDLSAMIEYKINQRNDLAKKRPRPDGIIQIIDREIDILEKIEQYIALMEQRHATLLITAHRESFKRGVIAGKMEEKTGRPHPEYMFQ